MKLHVAEAARPRSWADLVRGKENAVGSAPQTSPVPTPSLATSLTPAQRGEKSVLCRGKLLVMLGHYGWIAPDQTIDHPDISRRAGRVYLSRKDVRAGTSLEAGTEVEFFLYVDADGLGAEDCRPSSDVSSRPNTKARKWHPPALTHQLTSVPAPGPVILLRPSAVEHWMEEAAPLKQVTTSSTKDEKHLSEDGPQAVVSEASTSAGESCSESEGCTKRVASKASRRTATVMPPPGLSGASSYANGLLPPPPGLDLPS